MINSLYSDVVCSDLIPSQLCKPLEDHFSSAMTMRRLFVWVQELLERMKLMAIIVDTCKGLCQAFTSIIDVQLAFNGGISIF